MRLSGSELACVRGGRNVFAGLDFSISAGEALIITGANGAGKSSLLRLIAGLVHRSGGELRFEGGDSDLTIPEQAHYLGHQDALKPSLSVTENLDFWQRFLGGAAAAGGPALAASAGAAALAAVGLERIADLPAAYLSAGQRRRLSIARLISVPRPIWLLDEPTSALDVGAQGMLAELMREHLSGGRLILAATHVDIGLRAPRELRLGASP